MKRFFTALLAITIFIPSFSQTIQKKVKVTETYKIAKASKKLNSQLRVFGTQRSTVAVMLPANTIGWYYVFSTRKDGQAAKNLQLGLELAGVVASIYTGGTTGVLFSGITKAAAGKISSPLGSVSINAYVLNPDEASKFLNGGNFNHYISASITDATNAEMPMEYIGKDLLYIGFENNDNIDAAVVDFEIVALVTVNNVVTEQAEQPQQPTYGTPNSATYSKSEFVGTYRDENSTFTMDAKGNFFIRWDDGKTASGRWDLIDDKMNFDMRNVESNPYKRNDFYKIIFWDGTNLKYQSMRTSAVTYNAKKISQ